MAKDLHDQLAEDLLSKGYYAVGKKPLILGAYAMNYVAFLSCYDLIGSTSNNETKRWIEVFIYYILTYSIAGVAMLYIKLKQAKYKTMGTPEAGIYLAALAVKLQIVVFVSWAALYATSTSIGQQLEMQKLGALKEGAQTQWVLAFIIVPACYLVVFGSKALTIMSKGVCCACCFSQFKIGLDADTVDATLRGTADTLHGTNTSALAWLAAVSFESAIAVLFLGTAVHSSPSATYVGFSWLSAVVSTSFAVGMLYINQLVVSSLALDKQKMHNQFSSHQSKTKTNLIAEIKDDAIGMTVYVMTYTALGAFQRTVVDTMKACFDDEHVQAYCILAFTIVAIVLVSFVALLLEQRVQRTVAKLTNPYELDFYHTLCSSFGYGLSGVFGKMMHYAASSLLNVYASSDMAYVLTKGIYAIVVTSLAIFALSVVSWLPGDLEILHVDSYIADRRAELESPSTNSTLQTISSPKKVAKAIV